jgi:galactokinase
MISAYAPGRVELLGNHTDYNDGVVLAVAVDRGCTVIGHARDDGVISLCSAAEGKLEVELSALAPQTKAPWANYAIGVIKELIVLGVPVTGFSAVIEGDLPIACGLSSSAALEIAIALFVLKLARCKLPPLTIAEICQRAEHRFVGVQCGLLDQVTCIFGRRNQAVFFDCRTKEVRRIRFPADVALIVAESGTSRVLAASKYNERREETALAAKALGIAALRDSSPDEVAKSASLSPGLRRRALHVVEENVRVWRALDLLDAGDRAALGELMNASHESSRVNFENSTPELDLLVAIARGLPGVLGSRLTGAGFGGATVTLCRRPEERLAAEQLAQKYTAQTRIVPRVFVCRVADGAA